MTIASLISLFPLKFRKKRDVSTVSDDNRSEASKPDAESEESIFPADAEQDRVWGSTGDF